MAELVYPPVIFAARTLFAALGLRFDIGGAEHIPRTGGAVLASNHVSYLDFMFCGFGALPSDRLVRFMAKEAVFRHRIAGPLMRGMHHIPVDRAAGAGAYRVAVSALRAGEIVGVFPEATISRSFTLKEFRSGAARMAGEAAVPLIPMVTWGGQRVLTKGRPRDLHRGRTVVIRIGPALPEPLPDDPAATMLVLRESMQALLELAQAAHPDTPGPGARDTGDGGTQDRWWLPGHLGGSAPTPEEAAALDAAEQHARRRAATASAAPHDADPDPARDAAPEADGS